METGENKTNGSQQQPSRSEQARMRWIAKQSKAKQSRQQKSQQRNRCRLQMQMQVQGKPAARRSDRETRDAGGVEWVDRFGRSRQGMAQERTAVQMEPSVHTPYRIAWFGVLARLVLVFGIGHGTCTFAQHALRLLRTASCPLRGLGWPRTEQWACWVGTLKWTVCTLPGWPKQPGEVSLQDSDSDSALGWAEAGETQKFPEYFFSGRRGLDLAVGGVRGIRQKYPGWPWWGRYRRDLVAPATNAACENVSSGRCHRSHANTGREEYQLTFVFLFLPGWASRKCTYCVFGEATRCWVGVWCVVCGVWVGAMDAIPYDDMICGGRSLLHHSQRKYKYSTHTTRACMFVSTL